MKEAEAVNKFQKIRKSKRGIRAWSAFTKANIIVKTGNPILEP